MKILIITDYFNVSIFINSYNSTIYDAEILSNDLIYFHNKYYLNFLIFISLAVYDILINQ